METENHQNSENLFDLERSVLGSMLLLGDSDVPEWVERIDANMFIDPKCRQIGMAVDELIGQHQPIEPVAVVDKLRSWDLNLAADVAEIENEAATVANLNYQARRLVEKHRMRRLKRELKNLTKEIDKLRMDEIRDGIEALVQIAQPAVAIGEMESIQDCTKSWIRNMQHAPAEKVFLQTGIPSVDEELILNRSELTILGARPSMGKTALAALVGRYASQRPERGSVAMFSLEMSKTAIVRRLLAAESGIEDRRLAEAYADGKLTEAINSFYQLDFRFDDRPDMSIDAMRANLRALNRVQLVIVDYLQLVKIDRKRERRDLMIGDITKGLKLIAKEFNCHVLALSQLSRKVEDRNPPIPKLSDLRDSGNLEEDADNVIFLYRPHVYDKSQDKEKAILKIDKQRNGKRDLEIKIRWLANVTKFTEW